MPGTGPSGPGSKPDCGPDHQGHRPRQLPLHFDHIGANRSFAGRPIHCQHSELETARTTEYTVPGLDDSTGIRYELLDGETEIAPGVHVIPPVRREAGEGASLRRVPALGGIACGFLGHTAERSIGTGMCVDRRRRRRTSG